MFNRKPSTDNAIKSISKALDELDAVVAVEQAEIARIDGVIKEATDARTEATTRRDRAATVAERFAALIA